MIILAIETSCDDTASAIIEAEKDCVKILSNVVSSQIKIHSKWGGVVPNLAAREHLKNIVPVIKESLKKARLSPQEIDLIAVTQGPGLIPALLVGSMTAKTLAYLWKKPLMGVHHIEGHIYANFINSSSDSAEKEIRFPILCLVASGGHTQLILMKNHLDYEIVGQTLDDAAGEAFDKVARILSLGYPGGPIISQKAELFRKNSPPFLEKKFPRPMINSANFDFSFSGLKTAVLYTIRKKEKLLTNTDFINEVCYEFQEAVCETLVQKTIKATKKYAPKVVMIAGGVSANTHLRQKMKKAIAKNFGNEISFLTPEISHSVDNGAMIASVAYWKFKLGKNKAGLKLNWKNMKTDSNLKLNPEKLCLD